LSEYGKLEMDDYRAEFEDKARHKGLNPDHLESRMEQLLPIFKKR
jgi:hypothetical protein